MYFIHNRDYVISPPASGGLATRSDDPVWSSHRGFILERLSNRIIESLGFERCSRTGLIEKSIVLKLTSGIYLSIFSEFLKY